MNDFTTKLTRIFDTTERSTCLTLLRNEIIEYLKIKKMNKIDYKSVGVIFGLHYDTDVNKNHNLIDIFVEFKYDFYYIRHFVKELINFICDRKFITTKNKIKIYEIFYKDEENITNVIIRINDKKKYNILRNKIWYVLYIQEIEKYQYNKNICNINNLKKIENNIMNTYSENINADKKLIAKKYQNSNILVNMNNSTQQIEKNQNTKELKEKKEKKDKKEKKNKKITWSSVVSKNLDINTQQKTNTLNINNNGDKTLNTTTLGVKTKTHEFSDTNKSTQIQQKPQSYAQEDEEEWYDDDYYDDVDYYDRQHYNDDINSEWDDDEYDDGYDGYDRSFDPVRVQSYIYNNESSSSEDRLVRLTMNTSIINEQQPIKHNETWCDDEYCDGNWDD